MYIYIYIYIISGGLTWRSSTPAAGICKHTLFQSTFSRRGALRAKTQGNEELHKLWMEGHVISIVWYTVI